MKYVRVFKLMTVILSMAISANSTKPKIPYPFDLSLEPVDLQKPGGEVTLRLIISSTSACEEVNVAVTGIDNLQYVGDTTWNYGSKTGDTNIFNLSVVIPENDTSGVIITSKCVNWPDNRIGAYFISDDSGVRFFDYNPRRVPRTPIGAPVSISDPRKTDENWENKGTISYEDEDGNLVPIDSVVNGLSPSGKRVGTIDQNGNFIPLDSLLKLSSVSKLNSTDPAGNSEDRTKAWTRDAQGNQIRVDRDSLMGAIKEQRIEAEYEEMRELEKTPLTEFNRQYIKVEGKEYTRAKGESKFHLVESTSDPVGYAVKYRDSLNIQKGKVFEYNFDLRDPAHFEYAKSKIRDLLPTDSEGFYRATIDWKTVLDFKEKGIVFHKIGWRPKGTGTSQKADTIEKKN